MMCLRYPTEMLKRGVGRIIAPNAGALRSGDIDLLLLKHLTADWLCTWLRTYSSAPILQNTLLVFGFFCAAEHLFEFKN